MDKTRIASGDKPLVADDATFSQSRRGRPPAALHVTYDEMVAARMAFFQAYRHWVVQADPAAALAEDEAAGTVAQLRGFASLCDLEGSSDGR